jgi:hypothetical protein
MNKLVNFLSGCAVAGLLVVSSTAIAAETVVPFAPVPLNTSGKNIGYLKRGSYLVNVVANCGSCHSTVVYKVGTDPFKGDAVEINAETYLSGGKKYAKDTITSTNLTPDASGKPAGLTLKQFKAAMTKGTDPEDATKLIPIHPWPIYKNMTTYDLTSIYTYLLSIPSLEMPVVTTPPPATGTTPPVTGTTPAAGTTTPAMSH